MKIESIFCPINSLWHSKTTFNLIIVGLNEKELNEITNCTNQKELNVAGKELKLEGNFSFLSNLSSVCKAQNKCLWFTHIQNHVSHFFQIFEFKNLNPENSNNWWSFPASSLTSIPHHGRVTNHLHIYIFLNINYVIFHNPNYKILLRSDPNHFLLFFLNPNY